MNWFIEIFEAKSDQARLVAILISAIVAVLVVLLNQWFNSRRARKETLIEKIEELYELSEEYVKACRELLLSVQDSKSKSHETTYNPPRDLQLALNGSINKIQMILGLYFHKNQFDPHDFYMWNMPIIEIAQKDKVMDEESYLMAWERSEKHIVNARHKLRTLCIDLMRKNGH